jgi:hypothetical protein
MAGSFRLPARAYAQSLEGDYAASAECMPNKKVRIEFGAVQWFSQP